MTTTPPSRVASLALSVVLTGCAALGGDGGGGDNLPNRGIVPYDRLVAGEPEAEVFALASDEPTTRIYVEPHALLLDDQQIVLFAEDKELGAGRAAVIRCDVEATLTCGPPRTVLDPDMPGGEWLDGRAGAPSVVRHQGAWLMAFAYGIGAGIGAASSVDGEHFTLDDLPLLEATDEVYESGGIDSPSLIRTETGYTLYYQGRDADGVTRILVADGDDGLTFERRGVALDTGLDCRDVNGESEPCWDTAGVESPEVRVGTTAAGRRVFRLFYTGHGPNERDVGFAASWDGLTFERFVFNPVVSSAAHEKQATNLRVGDRYLLFYEEFGQTMRGIAVAINAPPAPSETF